MAVKNFATQERLLFQTLKNEIKLRPFFEEKYSQMLSVQSTK